MNVIRRKKYKIPGFSSFDVEKAFRRGYAHGWSSATEMVKNSRHNKQMVIKLEKLITLIQKWREEKHNGRKTFPPGSGWEQFNGKNEPGNHQPTFL